MGSRLWEPSCSRLGTARRCEPPPAPRVPTLCGRGAQHPTPAGVPESARKNACLWRTGGQPGRCGTQEEQLRKPSEDTSSLAKNVWDGGGSHRRSRAASTAALMDVATETPLTPAPVRVRSSQGEEQLPLPCADRSVGHRTHPTVAWLARCAGCCPWVAQFSLWVATRR